MSTGIDISVDFVDFNVDTPLSTGTFSDASLENFNLDNTFDLDFTCLRWVPNGAGGFTVTLVPISDDSPAVPFGTGPSLGTPVAPKVPGWKGPPRRR